MGSPPPHVCAGTRWAQVRADDDEDFTIHESDDEENYESDKAAIALETANIKLVRRATHAFLFLFC